MTQHPNPPLGGDEAKVEPVAWGYAYRQVLFGGTRIAPKGEWKLIVMRNEGDDWFVADLISQGDRYEVQPLYAAPVLPVEVREAESLRRVAEEMADLLALATSPDRFGEAGTGDVYLRMVAAERRFRTIKGDA